MLSPDVRAQIDAAAELVAAKFPSLTQDQIDRAAAILNAERAVRHPQRKQPAA